MNIHMLKKIGLHLILLNMCCIVFAADEEAEWRRETEAFMAGHHARVGAESPLQEIPAWFMQEAAEKVKPLMYKITVANKTAMPVDVVVYGQDIHLDPNQSSLVKVPKNLKYFYISAYHPGDLFMSVYKVEGWAGGQVAQLSSIEITANPMVNIYSNISIHLNYIDNSEPHPMTGRSTTKSDISRIGSVFYEKGEPI